MYQDRGPREMHDVTCAECGVATTVPFKPSGDRPVKCRDCFSKGRPSRDGPRNDRGPRRDREEHEVTCAECGSETTVPFKPTGDRPVLCRDCFKGSKPARNDNREMHDVNCTRCGAGTSVPFKPTPGRDVLCNDCFRR